MMALGVGLKEAVGAAIAISTIGGGALTIDHLYASASWAEHHEAEHRVRTILDLSDRANGDGQDWICDALDEEFIALCTEIPEHYLCNNDEAKRDILAKAGC